MAARASYITGFAGSATVLAGQEFGIPIYGTMAHSFIESFDDEMAAFAAFARSRPDNLVLLLDTYDTEAAARKVVGAGAEAQERRASRSAACVSIPATLSRCRRACARFSMPADCATSRSSPAAGSTRISSPRFARQNAPIDGIGIGTSMTTSSDVPALDCVYKLQEYAGIARRKRAVNKITWPGRKQVWRRYGADGRMAGDILSLEATHRAASRSFSLVMQGGQRVQPAPSLDDIRRHAKRELELLPEPLRRLEPGAAYPVEIGGDVESPGGGSRPPYWHRRS